MNRTFGGGRHSSPYKNNDTIYELKRVLSGQPRSNGGPQLQSTIMTKTQRFEKKANKTMNFMVQPTNSKTIKASVIPPEQ